jgi:putative ABC transport system permease protein
MAAVDPEALQLSAFGGVGRILLDVAVTTGYALPQGWPVAVPGWVQGTVGATSVIGGIAALYPAIRAARLSPTEALAQP